MNYQGYGSTSKKAERQRALAESLMPQNIGGPVNGIGGGLTQLAQVLMSKKASKKADAYDEAHRAQMAEALKGATAGMSPDQQAFAQAFPELFAKSQAANMFPDAMEQKRFERQLANDTFSQGLQTRQADRADRVFDYDMQRDIAGDKIAAENLQYNRSRDAAADAMAAEKFAYQQKQDGISNALNQQKADTSAASAAKTSLGKTPIYLRGEDGQVSIGQLGNGRIVPATVADGMTIVDPMQKAQMQQQGRSQGKIQGESFQNFPAIETNANRALKTVDQLLNHKGIDAGTGFSAKLPAIPGTDKYAFNVANKQAQGQVFLQGFEALKGGGVITEVEGLKAEQALARMDQAQSREDYEAGLRDYKSVIENGMAAARRKAGIADPQAQQQDFSEMSMEELQRIAGGG